MVTSLGYHTFSMGQALTYSDAMGLYRNFQRYKKETGEVSIRPIGKDKKKPSAHPKGYIVEYPRKKTGITWYIRFKDEMPWHNRFSMREPRTCSVSARINPKVLSGISDYLTAANARDFEQVEARFNEETKKISPNLGRFDDYSLNRIDYCLNLDLREMDFHCSPEQLMILIKRGDSPKHSEEWSEYDGEISHRQKSKKYAHYLRNGSINVNAYSKYHQLLAEWPGSPAVEASRYVVRFEIQCKYAKVYSMGRIVNDKLRGNMSAEELDKLFTDFIQGFRITNPVKGMLSDILSRKVIQYYFNKVVRKGDYLTLDGARWMVEELGFRRDKEERLIFALETVSECRGIVKAKTKLSGEELRGFKRSLKDLDALQINPVTIPREWEIDHIPNPLRAYYDHTTEEQLVPYVEGAFVNLLKKYRSSCGKH